MQSKRVQISENRPISATHDLASPGSTACVVACPPHPRFGGSRGDPRLRAVAKSLCQMGIDCLRFDYGPWDHGTGELIDAHSAIDWAMSPTPSTGRRYRSIGLFGYSFGGGIGIMVAGSDSAVPGGVAILAPPNHLEGQDLLPIVDGIDRPMLIIVGTRDETVDWQSVVDATPESTRIKELESDHFFRGQYDRIGRLVADFFERLFPDE